jgi:hypothetical protein
VPVEGRSLVGFMDPAFALPYLQQATVPPDLSPGALTGVWQQARDQLGLDDPPDDPGEPEFLEIDAAHAAHLTAVAANPRLQGGLDGQPFEFKLVEIDPLLAYQRDISVERTAHLCAQLGNPPTVDSMLPVMLPTAVENTPTQGQETPNSVLVVSPSANVKIHAHGRIGFDPNVGMLLFGIAVGPSGPWVHVVRFEGRTYLRNGFHRVYGAKRAGATHVPCIVVDAPNWEFVGARGEGATFEKALLESDNPPTLAHYAEGRAWPVQLRRWQRIIEVNWAEYLLPEPDAGAP